MKYTSRAAITSETAALASGIKLGSDAQGLESLGASLMGLGQQLHQTRMAREIAQASAQYNEELDRYLRSLQGKDPKDYDFVKGFGFDAQGRVKSIAANRALSMDMSREAREKLENQFVEWDSVNTAHIARMAIQKDKEITIDLLKDDLINAANHGQKDAFVQRLDEIPWLTDREKQIYINEFDKIAEKRALDIQTTQIFNQLKDLKDANGSWIGVGILLSDPNVPQKVKGDVKIMLNAYRAEQDEVIKAEILRQDKEISGLIINGKLSEANEKSKQYERLDWTDDIAKRIETFQSVDIDDDMAKMNVRDAVTRIAMSRITREDAVKTLLDNSDKLTKTTKSRYFEEIYSEIDKRREAVKNKSRSHLIRLVTGQDPTAAFEGGLDLMSLLKQVTNDDAQAQAFLAQGMNDIDEYVNEAYEKKGVLVLDDAYKYAFMRAQDIRKQIGAKELKDIYETQGAKNARSAIGTAYMMAKGMGPMTGNQVNREPGNREPVGEPYSMGNFIPESEGAQQAKVIYQDGQEVGLAMDGNRVLKIGQIWMDSHGTKWRWLGMKNEPQWEKVK